MEKFTVKVTFGGGVNYHVYDEHTFSTLDDAKLFARLLIESAEFEKKFSGQEIGVSVWDECMFPYVKQGEYGIRVNWLHHIRHGFSSPEDYKKTVVWYNKNMPHSKLETKELGIPV